MEHWLNSEKIYNARAAIVADSLHELQQVYDNEAKCGDIASTDSCSDDEDNGKSTVPLSSYISIMQ